MDPQVCDLSGPEPAKEETVLCLHGYLISEGPQLYLTAQPGVLPLTCVRVLVVPGEMS